MNRFVQNCLYLSPLILVGVVIIATMINWPGPAYVELPEFKGRILPASQVYPGTFTIRVEFSSVSQWDNNGIIAFEDQNGAYLRAWRPDLKTTGVYEYADKKVDKPELWGWLYKIARMETRGEHLKLIPVMSDEAIATIIFAFGGLILITLLKPFFE